MLPPDPADGDALRAGHRDSGRVNQELQDDGGNPRVSLKVGFIITDTTERTGFQYAQQLPFRLLPKIQQQLLVT